MKCLREDIYNYDSFSISKMLSQGISEKLFNSKKVRLFQYPQIILKTMEEIWKIIPDYPNYKVSNLGRVINIKKNNFTYFFIHVRINKL